MPLHIQYLTDERGIRQAVQIPVDEWEHLLQDYAHLKQYATLKHGLIEAWQDGQKIQEGQAQYMTLEELLNEC